MTAITPEEIGRNPAYVWIMLTFCFIAVILNVFVIFVVVKFGRYRASIDIFLTNLAASDIIHAGIVTPVHFKNVTAYNHDFYGDNFVCKMIMFLPLLSVMGAILTIVAIAIDRYRVIVVQKQLYRRGAITAIIIIWIASILVSAPQLYEYNVYYDRDEYNSNVTYKSCGSEGIVENFEAIYASLVFIFAFLVPCFILVVCYTQIMLYVWRHGRRFRATCMRSTGNRENENRQANKMLTSRMFKLVKMLMSITVTFVVLWTPFFIIFAMTEVMGIDDTSNFSEWPHVVSRAMTLLSTISNPVFFLAFSETFKEAFVNTICNNIRRHDNRRQSLARSNKIAPMTPREKHGTCVEALEMKSTLLKVFSLTSEPENVKNSS